ncbi:MAG: tetratricopeptide repeat protein [Acidobacteriia bacterium]|nr:tetratricopeptide repeat protein [Terriglobia bacterium]
MPCALFLAALLLQSGPQAEGLQALEAKQYPAAVAAFRRAVEADAKDFSAHFHLALAQSLAGNDAAAIEGYRKTLELKPGLYEAGLNLGIVLLNQNQAEEAVQSLRAASVAKPAEFRPTYYYAEALLATSSYEAAASQFANALTLDPKSAASHNGLARALAGQGRIDEAETHFRQAEKLDPAYRDGLLQLAGLREKSKNYDAAIAIYSEFLDQVAVRERLGQLYLETARPAEAIPHLEHAAKVSPTAANLYALGTAYLRSKETSKAMATFEQALASEPANAELRLSYAGLLRDQKNFSAAAQQYWRVTQLQPASKAAWTGVATMLLSLENYAQALAAFDRLEALGDPAPGIYFFRALAQDHSKQYQQALESYQRFLSLSQEKHPDEEFKARQRVKVIQKELSKR